MVKIRLSRGGACMRPFYHVVVIDSRRSRDSRCIERIGFFNPIATGKEQRLKIDVERVDSWIKQGAQLSGRVSQLVREQRATAA